MPTQLLPSERSRERGHRALDHQVEIHRANPHQQVSDGAADKQHRRGKFGSEPLRENRHRGQCQRALEQFLGIGDSHRGIFPVIPPLRGTAQRG